MDNNDYCKTQLLSYQLSARAGNDAEGSEACVRWLINTWDYITMTPGRLLSLRVILLVILTCSGSLLQCISWGKWDCYYSYSIRVAAGLQYFCSDSAAQRADSVKIFDSIYLVIVFYSCWLNWVLSNKSARHSRRGLYPRFKFVDEIISSEGCELHEMP